MAQTIKESSLRLAFLGDAVYELVIRDAALKQCGGHVDTLNRFSKQYSRAVMQAQLADVLMTDDFLTEEEAAVYKRGRNAKSASLPKSCTPAQYRKATGLEALCGYLFLKQDMKRVTEILHYAAERVKEDGE